MLHLYRGTDGFWSEDLPKPWRNDAERGVAMKSFQDRQSDWYPTWPSADDQSKRAMIVDSVKMVRTLLYFSRIIRQSQSLMRRLFSR